MEPYWKSSDGEIYHGNVLDVLRELPDESVQMCVTSPPYWGLRDYGNEPVIWENENDLDNNSDCIVSDSGSSGAVRRRMGLNCEHVWGDDLKNKLIKEHYEKWQEDGFDYVEEEE